MLLHFTGWGSLAWPGWCFRKTYKRRRGSEQSFNWHVLPLSQIISSYLCVPGGAIKNCLMGLSYSCGCVVSHSHPSCRMHKVNNVQITDKCVRVFGILLSSHHCRSPEIRHSFRSWLYDTISKAHDSARLGMVIKCSSSSSSSWQLSHTYRSFLKINWNVCWTVTDRRADRGRRQEGDETRCGRN